MRIAIFAETYYPFISGVVTHIETLRNGLEAAGHEVLIVTLSPKAQKHYIKDGVLYCPAVPLKKIYGFGVANPVNLHRLKMLRRFNPDIIHIQTEFSMGIFGLYAAKHLKKPVVYTLHTMYDDYVFYVVPDRMVRVAQPATHAYFRNVASKATEIIGPSHKVAEYLEKCGVKRHINIIPNTVDVSAFLPKSVDAAEVQAAREALGLKDGDTALCFVGRLGQEKSIDVLIDFFQQGFGGEESYKLFIIGDGPQKEELKTQIRSLGLQKQVKLLGKIEHDRLPAYYQACNLFTTASLSEMNSISLLEATASGLYAVTMLDEKNLDQVENGKNGETYTTPEEYKEIVGRYAALPDAEKQALKESVVAYATRYGPKEFTQAVENVYIKAIVKYSTENRD